ncbi:polysaccharide deacetylase family protein [bacterium]|nr:polysaccharide deacetylase family protein [bacterium]
MCATDSSTPPPFPWPDGNECAVSLSYDDARLSQIDAGIPLLNRYGIRGTFYVSIPALEKRLPQWREAVRAGHEIGNHTVHHPCSANFPWDTAHVLEELTFAQMDWELTEANACIEKLVGVVPQSFAYPCGQKYVGRGRRTRSYVPLVARRSLIGRGFSDEYANNPRRCDLAQVFGINFDPLTVPQVLDWIAKARRMRGWVVFAGHEMGREGYQAMSAAVLEKVCQHLTEPNNGIWVETVAAVGAHIQKQRRRRR